MVSKTTYLTQKQKMIDQIICSINHFGFSDAYGIFKNYCSSQILILMYHRVGPNKSNWLLPPISTNDFENQMRYLSKTHKILPLNDLAKYIIEGKTVDEKIAVVTFDDGYKDNYICAFPILKKYNIPATVFLVTGNIGTKNLFWFDKIRYLLLHSKIKRINLNEFGDFTLNTLKNRLFSSFIISEKLKKIPNEKKNNILEEIENISDVNIPVDLAKNLILSWDEVKEMNECSVDFGAHTVTHPILTRISFDRAKYEISQSKKNIEKKIGKTVNTFCYPNGTSDDFNTNLLNFVTESGFSCAVTTIPIIDTSKANLYRLGRLPTAWSFESFKFLISGCYSDASSIMNRFRRSNV